MDRIREAWDNDTLLSMASAFCVGLSLGVIATVFFIQAHWMPVPLGIALLLLCSGTGLLGRAERVRAARWQRREWR